MTADDSPLEPVNDDVHPGSGESPQTYSAPPAADLSPTTSSPTGLPLEGGAVTVSEVVVAKIAALAAREVAGVHSLGVGAARSVTSVRDRIPGSTPSITSGVSVEVGRTQAAVDLDIVVEYGTPIPQIARDVRTRVIDVVEDLTGLEVVEVNITVDDVNLPAPAQQRDKRLQ